MVDPDVLPMFPNDDPPDRPAALEDWLYSGQQLKRQPSEIAGLLRTATDPLNRYWLWAALVDAWAEKCRPKGRHRANPAVKDAVRSIEAEIYSADEFPMTRMDSSEILDLDHLSAPRFPRLGV